MEQNGTADAGIESRLQRIEAQNDAIIKALQKKKKNAIWGLEDENEERGNWSGRFDFFLSCLGYAVGLGNVWRFPYLCYKNGGGAFFIPYVIMLVFVGMPIFFMELSLGQFTGSGPLTCWKYAPIVQGVGVGMVAVSAMVSIYYNMIIAWSLYYLFASFTSELPWEKCRSEWSSNMCMDYIPILKDSTECFGTTGWTPKDDGACYNANGTVVAIYDQKLAKTYGIERELPSAQYFERYVTRNYFSDGLQDLGPMQWKLVLCYLLAFIFVIMALSKSIKSSGKVVYFTATFPYIVLIILFVRGLMLDGYREGIDFYIKPDLDRLSESVIWKDAAVQIFFSLSASWGGLIALSSYNRFHNDAMRDAFMVSVGNCLTSVFAGFVIFSYLGNLAYELGVPVDEVADSGPSLAFVVYPDAFMVSVGNCLTSVFAGFVIFSYLGNLAYELGVPVDEVADSGPSLAFVVYPYAVTKLPAAPFWSIIFFLMLITLGVDSEFVLVETVITALMDRFPKLRDWKFVTVTVICCIFFLLGLTMTTEGGYYMLQVMDTYSGGWNILFIAICECISICYFYGIRRFLQDIETMIGRKVCGCMPFFLLKFWWAFNWCFATPGLVAFIMIFSWVKYTDMEGEKYPEWADALGWLMTLTVIVAIIGGAIYALCTAKTPGDAFKPTVEWGPALVKHRALVAKYIPDYVVDPWGKEPTLPAAVSPNDVNLQEVKKAPLPVQSDPGLHAVYQAGPTPQPQYQSTPDTYIVQNEKGYLPRADVYDSSRM